MDKKEKYLVISHIGNDGGETLHQYGGIYTADCPHKVSLRNREELVIPLCFDSEQAARAYIEKASSSTEKEFYLIQEFSYHCETIRDEAKIIFSVKSDTWPTLDEGKTERAPGVWAHVRSIFVCDKYAALDYVARFNGDAAAAFEAGHKK